MSEPSFTINGKSYPIPVELTLGELAEAEKITGQGYDLDVPGALGTLALAYIAVKRMDPTVTLNDIQLLKPSDVKIEGGEGDALPPAADAGSSASGDPSSESS